MINYIFAFVVIIALYALFHKRSNNAGIQKLLRQSARWSTAAQQDESPLVAVLHANYGVAYLWALKDIATTKEIHNATGVDLKKFEEHIINVQDMVNRKVVKKCPEFAGDVDLYLSAIGGES